MMPKLLLLSESVCSGKKVLACRKPARASSTVLFASGLIAILLAGSAPGAAGAEGSPVPAQYFGGENHQGYLDWIASSPVKDWASTAFLESSSDPALGAALHWQIQFDDAAATGRTSDAGLCELSNGTIELAVATRSTGWLGFGLSQTGGMLGTDMFVVEARNLSAIWDMHVLDERQPAIDECQNWELVSADVTDDGFFLVRVSRALDTGDPQDRKIQCDGDTSYYVSYAIAAWGDSEAYGYHGPSRARSALRWHSSGTPEGQLFADKMQAASASSFFVGASNHSVKLNDTEYAHFCTSSADLKAAGIDMDGQGVTVVGFDAVIDKPKHVHHFLLYASTQELDETVECGLGGSRELLYLWGPGEPPFAFPDNVGMPLGGVNVTGGGYRSFVLQVHYDNAELIPDQLDSSGVTLYYSQEPREYMAGVMDIGDPFLYLRDQVIPAGVSDYLFECPGTCSSVFLGDGQPVTVVREYLHMHQSGYAMYNQHVRDGQVVRTGSVDFFDFSQSGGPAVQQQPFEVLPGDAFSTRCYYKNDEGSNRTFGFGSAQEMCMAFLLYYPRKVIAVSENMTFGWFCGAGLGSFGFTPCDAAFNVSSLQGGEAPAWRTFGLEPGECAAAEAGSPGPGPGATSGLPRGGPSWFATSLLGAAAAAVAARAY